eukprot:GFUD01036995.1.p1 GENE.GFUD01036995.1~~GFUD01036995.1.p1  ORF type:complete len:485 (-),score=101.36 GFUD01036995.1:21-1475(-)
MLLVDMMTILKVGIGMQNRLDRTKKEFREENCRISVNSMPREMLRMIFQKLEFKDLKNVMLVCRYWRSWGGDPILWRNFKMLCIRNPAYFVQILSIPRLSRIENITLDGLYKSWAKYNDSHFDFLRHTCVKVLEINGIADVSDVSPDILAKVVNKCEIVDLGCCLTQDQYYEIFEEMSKETNLKKFWMPDNVRNVPADILGAAVNNIEDVTLTDLTPYQILSIFMIMSKTSKTLHLNIHTAYLTHLPNSIFCSAVSKLKSLTASLDQYKMSSLMNNLSKGANLTYLHLGQSDLTQVQAGVLARGLVRVETVEMMWTGLDPKQIIELCLELVKDHSVMKHLHLNHDLTGVPVDILARAINQLETAGILMCPVTEEQTIRIFTEMSNKTNIKRINYNDLRAPLIMPGLGKVGQDTLAKAINKLEDVLIHIGEADNEISPDQVLAILQRSSVETNLKRVGIFNGGYILPDNAVVEQASRKISNFLMK